MHGSIDKLIRYIKITSYKFFMVYKNISKHINIAMQHKTGGRYDKKNRIGFKSVFCLHDHF